ncbi:adenosylcobinamide hydrolase [Methanohalophilus levihalophilus]|uniref:adenosylcobinamide amidohydrolase n=1 Tax=Methanohalophilus levihalophilus TaxID=1431282 RepID=UPI001FD8E89A|nr:adenosylcobinamide amidohydrolase [Methanohalophilus levihalophilus]MBP2029209.1 adenosylcobinamide hydrolase [Methanohalophilus levihalophilus]
MDISGLLELVVGILMSLSPDYPVEKAETKVLFETSSGERILLHDDYNLIVALPPGRVCMSTSWLNGGINENLEAIVNHCIPRKICHEQELEGGSLENYLGVVASSLGYNSSSTSVLLTAASMRNASVVSHSYRGLEVSAIVTAGIEVNGCRVGDPASYYQEDGQWKPFVGTINIMLLIGAALPQYALSRAIITVTEAKAAVLQELMISSQYSSGIATGTGTDMLAIVSNSDSNLNLTDAGPHSKLGELIGKCVHEGIRDALLRQSDISALAQRDTLVRLERFGITEASFWKASTNLEGENRKKHFIATLRDLSSNPSVVSLTSSVLHLVDEVSWGLLPEASASKIAVSCMRCLPKIISTEADSIPDDLFEIRDPILDNFVRAMAWTVKNKIYD